MASSQQFPETSYDEETTEILSKLIDEASKELDEEQMRSELENTPVELMMPYDGPLLSDHHFCTDCPKKYKYRKHLNRHRRTKHKNDLHQDESSKRPHETDDKENTPLAKRSKKTNQVGGGGGEEEDTSVDVRKSPR